MAKNEPDLSRWIIATDRFGQKQDISFFEQLS